MVKKVKKGTSISSSGKPKESGRQESVNESVEAAVKKAKWLKQWLKNDPKRLAIVALAVVVVLFLSLRQPSAGISVEEHGLLRETSYGEEEAREEVKPKKKKAAEGPSESEFAQDLAEATHTVNAVGEPIAADKFNVKLRPLVYKGNQIICPDKGGGKYNKICSKAYAEYLFQVPKPGTYYVYVETVAPNINDNSLWVGVPSVDSLSSCPSQKAGPLVPHKHVKSKKWLCCPKYLESNAKKGQGKFYCDCCISNIGPHSDDMGCILDLEVSTKPQWNMLPRALQVKSTTDPLKVRLFAREDGSAWTRVLVSPDPLLKDIP